MDLSSDKNTKSVNDQEELSRIKDSIENSWREWQHNCERFHFFRNFTFRTSISQTQKAWLKAKAIPELEFNICEAYVSRLRGEWSKQEPGIYVSPVDGAQVRPEVIDFAENHLRHQTYEASKENFQFEVLTDTLSGGFSAAELYTEYASPMSFDQVIRWRKILDPTQCGWDILAEKKDKSDGRFCYKLYHYSADEFERKFGLKADDKFSFVRAGDFNWSFKNGNEKIVVVCEYFEKKITQRKIVKLSNGAVMTLSSYKRRLKQHIDQGIIEAPPTIVEGPRKTDITRVIRFRVCQNQILDRKETDFNELPIKFFDGNSVWLKEGNSNRVKQVTRPYIYNAVSIQLLQNYSGQAWAGELEQISQQRLIISEDALPKQDDYLQMITDPTMPGNVIYKGFKDDNPDAPNPIPSVIPRTQLPAELLQTFQVCSEMSQRILGSYDASLGINNNQLSGIAIVEGATQSNSAAMPYIVNYMDCYSSLARDYINLIPKYYITPRTVPVLDGEGNKNFQYVHADEEKAWDPQAGLYLDYDANALHVKVEAGLNFEVQKAKNLVLLQQLCQAIPGFSQFIGSKGLNVVIDNLDLKGMEILKPLADEYMQMVQQQQQQAAQQPNPEMIKAQLAQQNMQLNAQKIQLEQAKLQQASQQDIIDNHLKIAQIHADQKESRDKVKIEQERSYTERLGKAADLTLADKEMAHDHHLERTDMRHRHIVETSELLHKLESEENEVRGQEGEEV